jgi:hypothetical protein
LPFAVSHLPYFKQTVTKNVTIFGNNRTQWHTTAHNGIIGKFLVFRKLGVFKKLEKGRYASSIPAVSTI